MMPECEYYKASSTAAVAQFTSLSEVVWNVIDFFGFIVRKQRTFNEDKTKGVKCALQALHGVLFCQSSFNMVFLSSLKEAEKPFCERLHRVRDLMDRSKVSIEEVISELGQYLLIFDFIFFIFLQGF